MQVESTNKSNKRKKHDEFMEITDKILLKKGIKPKNFDMEAVKAARKNVYDDFVKNNIDLLLEILDEDEGVNKQ